MQGGTNYFVILSESPLGPNGLGHQGLFLVFLPHSQLTYTCWLETQKGSEGLLWCHKHLYLSGLRVSRGTSDSTANPMSHGVPQLQALVVAQGLTARAKLRAMQEKLTLRASAWQPP